MFIHILSLVGSHTFAKDWIWQNIPFHSAVEAAGASVALFVAYFLIRFQVHRSEDASLNQCLAAGLISMGMLDLIHAIAPVGQSFVWLHSLATFFGGLFFLSLWLPTSATLTRFHKSLPLTALVFSLSTGVYFSIFSNHTPQMLSQGEFTLVAKLINIMGGVFFILAAIKLLLVYLKQKNTHAFLFFLHSGLFGAASIMFEQSQLWDVAWWGWHFLRLLAFAVALYYTTLSYWVEEDEEKQNMLKQIYHSSKLASIGELAAGVGHEINNPLTVILANIKKMEAEILRINPNTHLIKNFLEKQKNEAGRISKIIQGLKSYSRADSDIQEILDAHEVIEQTLSLTSDFFQRDIRLEVDFHAQNHSLFGDTGKLQQVLVILLTNARDAMEDISNPVIRITTENQGGLFILKVRDNGCGIAEKNKDKIFESFFTTKEMGRGTGLGLGILSKIIYDMEGKVKVESSPGKGATFILSLPFVKDLKVDNFTPKKNNFTGRALIVEDEEDIRFILHDQLDSLGILVDEASSGEEGLEKLSANRYDYIFTDYKMPGMLGDEFIKSAKSITSSSTSYFLVSGGLASNFDPKKEKDIYALVDAFIEKPFDEEDLCHAIRNSKKQGPCLDH